jgi:hypothetical protein
MAQQEFAEAMPGPGTVLEQVGAGAAQVPHRLLGHGRHPNRHQLAGAVQPGQPPAVAAVGLDSITGRSGDEGRRNDLAANPQRGEQPGELIPGRAGLVAGSQPTTIWELRQEPANRRLVIRDPVDLSSIASGAEDRHRDGVPVHI